MNVVKKAVMLLMTTALMVSVLMIPANAEQTASVTIPVKQTFTVSGDSTGVSSVFNYELYASDSSNPMPAGTSSDRYTFTLDGTTEQNIGPIVYTHAGMYTYTLQQVVKEEKSGYTYDREVYTVTVQVKNTENGLTALVYVKKADGTKEAPVKFDNGYQSSNPESVTTPDTQIKKFINGTPETVSTFSFTIKSEEAAFPMPGESKESAKTVQIVGAGANVFGTWSYTKEGTYTYKVYEVNTGLKGYTYDNTIYTIKDTVEKKDGKLALTRTISNENGQEVNELKFTNVYSETTTPGGSTTEITNTTGGSSGHTSIISKGPFTGDTYNIMFFAGMMVISLIIITALIVMMVKRRKEKEQNTAEE